MSDNITNAPANVLVRSSYYDYARYINLGGRTICDEKDSLKAVQRRILYAAYMIGKSTHFKFTKTATVVGETIGKYHPHGDAACAGAIANMVNDGLMEGKGNFGSVIGIDPIDAAAMRYTECRLSESVKKLAFKYIDDVPYYLNDLGFQEPEYLPTPLPLNLCHFSGTETWISGIGFDLAYTLPKFDTEDLFNYLTELITKGNGSKDKIHIRYRTMSIPAPQEILETGKGTITAKAQFSIGKSGKSIIISEFPPMKKTIRMMLKPFDAILTDASKTSTCVEVTFGKGQSIKDFKVDEILTANQNVDMYFHNSKVIKHYSIDEILLSTYENFKKAVDSNLAKCYTSLSNKIETTNLLIKIKPYLNPYDENTAKRLSNKVDISIEKANELMKNSIKTICDASKNLSTLENQLKDVVKKQNNIDKFCLKEIRDSL